jgi:hypothetical protein
MTPEAFRKLLDERQMTSPSVGAGYDELVKDPGELVQESKNCRGLLPDDGLDTA